MESQAISRRLAQMSVAEKQRLLAELLREKSRRLAGPESAGSRWTEDAHLDEALQPIGPVSSAEDPGSILLTGASGFLGAHLLFDLLRSTRAAVHCLVRAGDPREAMERLSANCSRFFAERFDTARVRPVVGDLSLPDLGLTSAGWTELAREVDVIVHNGAQLHHMAPYEQLKASNVDSTLAMLRLSAIEKPKRLHFISTLAAAVDRDAGGLLLERFPEEDPEELVSGYTQTKWVSEKLLAEAARRGFEVTVFRPGFISGRSDSGIWPVEHDHLLRIIKGCVQMGAAALSDMTPNMAPVNFVSRAVVQIALSPGTAGRVFNLSNPHMVSWTTLLGWLGEFGYPVEMLQQAEWKERFLKHLDRDNALYPFLPLYLGGDTTDRHALLVSKLGKVRNDAAASILSENGIDFPVIDRALWKRYVQFFRNSGFLTETA